MKTICLKGTDGWESFRYTFLDDLKKEFKSRNIKIRNISIGDNVTIGNNVSIENGVTIDRDVIIESNVSIGNYSVIRSGSLITPVL